MECPVTQLCHMWHTCATHRTRPASWQTSYLSVIAPTWKQLVFGALCNRPCLHAFISAHSVHCIGDQGGTVQPTALPNSQHTVSTRGGWQLSRQLPTVGRFLHPPVWVSIRFHICYTSFWSLTRTAMQFDSLSPCLHVTLSLFIVVVALFFVVVITHSSQTKNVTGWLIDWFIHQSQHSKRVRVGSWLQHWLPVPVLGVCSGRWGVRRRGVHCERRLYPLRPDGQAGLLRHRHGPAQTGNNHTVSQQWHNMKL